MDAMDAILSRRSRKQFTDKPIPFEIIAEIVNAGNHAPSAGNLQNWKFIVITKWELRKELPVICHNQEWAAAPVSIVVISEPDVCKDYFKEKAEYYSTQNCAAATQNMLIAANNYGLGALWIGAFNEVRIKSLLEIPEACKVESIIALGYSMEIPQQKNFKELKTTVFFNKWSEKFSKIQLVDKDYTGIYESMTRQAKSTLSKGIDKLREKIKK